MNVTLELPPAEVRSDQPVIAAEAATDVQAAESLSETPDTQTGEETESPAAPEIDAPAAAERQKLRERVAKSSTLSRGMRDRFSALLSGDSTPQDQPGPLIRAADALALLEEVIPPQLRLDGSSLAPQEHPAGEVFFTGDASQMNDDAADRIAREQLAGSPWAKARG